MQMAQWMPTKKSVKGKVIDVEVGEILASNRYLMERWNWKSLTKVQSLLKSLESEGVLRSENIAVTSRITLTESELYARFEVAERSDKGRMEVAERSDKGRMEVADEVKENKEQDKQRNKETNPLAQAGGEIFEKLAKRVGPVTAKLCIEGNVGQLVGDEKRPQLLRWLEHKLTKGQPIITTQVLFAIVQQFQDNDLETLTNSITESIGGDYARLVITKPKPADKKLVFPNYWKPGIEVELKLTPEQTNEYYRHLIDLRWYKTTIQGQPYWNRPAADNAARTGEGTISKTLQQT